jgi:cytochrome c
MLTRKTVLIAGIAASALCIPPTFAQQHAQPAEAASHGAPDYGLGKTPTAQQIAGWDIDASQPDGSGLPPGSGSVSQGKKVYEENCVACHGPDGGGPMYKLVGGRGSLATKHPVQTVGSYWPYATTLWDYINRAMPLTNPHSLNHDQVYAVAAYVLYLNHIVPTDAVMNASTLPKVKMPNAEGFVSPDPRPDVHNMACMENCPELNVRTSRDASK